MNEDDEDSITLWPESETGNGYNADSDLDPLMTH
jgi:hypothetical protein